MFFLKRKFVKRSKKRKGLFGGRIKSMAEIKQLSNDIKQQEAKEDALLEQQINAELSQI